MVQFKYLTILLPLVLIIPYSVFNICDNCIKSCSVFTSFPVSECSNRCGFCKVFDNRFTNWLNWYHVDDYSYLKTDEKMCHNNYAETPKLEPNKNNKNNNKKKPNIVLIVLDDLDAYSPYFSAMKFARRLFKVNGTHFINGHTSTSFCCPARCQIFTGMYGHNNGVLSSYGTYGSVNAFRKPYNLNGTRMTENGKCINNEFRSLPVYLQKYGKYKTGIFGKYLNGFESDTYSTINYVPIGWDQFDITTNNFQYVGHMYTMTKWDIETNIVKYKWYGREPENYLTDVIATKAVKFINKHSKNKNSDPLFLYLAPTAPHFPQTGAHRHLKYLKYWESKFEEYFGSRPNFHSDESVNGKSSWLKSNSAIRDLLLNMKTDNWYSKDNINIHKLEFAKRMTTLYAIDEMLIRVYNAIKDQGKLDNTIFMLVSDNGFNMGSHKLYHKMTPYEESIRIPFYMSGSGIKKGHIDDRLVLLNDLAPTILNMAGFETPSHMDGIDLNTNKSRSGILIEYGKFMKNKNEDFTGNLNRVSEFKMAAKLTPYYMGFDVPPYTAIKTYNHLYVEYSDINNLNQSEYELYDMKSDPHQIHNIYNQTLKNNVGLIEQLRTKLKQLETCYGTECID